MIFKTIVKLTLKLVDGGVVVSELLSELGLVEEETGVEHYLVALRSYLH
jgi:hypothetical protein